MSPFEYLTRIFYGFIMPKNLFANSFSPSTNPDLLAPGNYTVELMDLKPGQSREFEGKPPKPTITFCFREVKTSKPINRTVTSSRDPRGKLYTLVCQLAGSNQPTTEILADGVKFTEFLEGLIGNRFKATVGVSPNGRFNDVLNAMPIESLKGGK